MQREQRTVALHHAEAAWNKSFVSCMYIWGFLSYFASSLLYSFGSLAHQRSRFLTHNQYILHNTSLPRTHSSALAPSLFCFASRRWPGFLYGAFLLKNQRRRWRKQNLLARVRNFAGAHHSNLSSMRFGFRQTQLVSLQSLLSPPPLLFLLQQCFNKVT